MHCRDEVAPCEGFDSTALCFWIEVSRMPWRCHALTTVALVPVIGKWDILVAWADNRGFVDGGMSAGDTLGGVEIGLKGLNGELVAQKEV